MRGQKTRWRQSVCICHPHGPAINSETGAVLVKKSLKRGFELAGEGGAPGHPRPSPATSSLRQHLAISTRFMAIACALYVVRMKCVRIFRIQHTQAGHKMKVPPPWRINIFSLGSLELQLRYKPPTAKETSPNTGVTLAAILG